MDTKYREALSDFQREERRMEEEAFARGFGEEPAARLFFINEGAAFTDGKNIVVDPAADELFCDRTALAKTAKFLHWDRTLLEDPAAALSVITRAQTLHECLHLLYTDFPGRHLRDPLCDTKNKRIVMGLIGNIIEDAYIEAAGASLYDAIEPILMFGRVSRLFASHPGEGTVYRTLSVRPHEEKEKRGERSGAEKLADLLDYMAGLLLYPMVKMDEPAADIADAVEKTRDDLFRGSTAPSPGERYSYTQKIFKVILPLIPPDAEKIPEEHFERLLGGTKTHGESQSLGGRERKGKSAAVTTRLFTSLDGKKKEMNSKALAEKNRAVEAEMRELSRGREEAPEDEGHVILRQGSDYDAAVIHRRIRVREVRPPRDRRLERPYRDICSRYRAAIRKYTSRFEAILRAETAVREEKLRYGSGLTSSRLGDPKKRWWHRDIPGEDVPDLAVLLLIDGSGSMRGARSRAARDAAIILHEVLAAEDIPHAVALHRACFTEPEIEAHLLLPFNARKNESAALMRIDADGDNRDALALLWAERYITRCAENDRRLILVISDGWPAHEYDDYYPPVSSKDTANAAAKIIKRGTDIIAVALDREGETETYDALSEIYPNLVSCSDLSRLTGQIISLLARILRQR